MNLEKLLYLFKEGEMLDSRSPAPINLYSADVSLMQKCIFSKYTTIRNISAHKLLTHLSLSNSEHCNVLFQIRSVSSKTKQQMIENNHNDNWCM